MAATMFLLAISFPLDGTTARKHSMIEAKDFGCFPGSACATLSDTHDRIRMTHARVDRQGLHRNPPLIVLLMKSDESQESTLIKKKNWHYHKSTSARAINF
jgi:hypothetical protein